GSLNIAVSDSGIAVNIGHTTSETTVNDNLSVVGNLTVGVNDTGGDVKFFGATSGAYMLWDESADELILADPAADATPLVLYNPLGTATTSRTVALDFSTGSADSPSNSHDPSGKILSGREGTYGASSTADSYMAFYTELNDTLAEKMRITSDGNVGIGVTSTTHTLLIKDSTAFVSGASNVANSAALQITSADGTGRGSMSIGGNDNVALFNPVSNALGLQAREYINFYCSNLNDDKVGTKTERMRITNGGLVGIGTTAPADQLHAIGTARINESTTLGQATNAGTAFEIRGDALAAGSTDVDAFKAFKIALNDGTEWGGQAQFSLGRWEESGSYARSSLVISLGHGSINSLTNA
ncbi:MAG: hypothetical protein QF704_15880, partial [Anaerolineales bacterium]|nr:hypothetical protein [Anaerolineales bacterium]